MGLDEMQKKKRSEYLEGNLMITECSQKKPYAFISYASDNWDLNRQWFRCRGSTACGFTLTKHLTS